MGGPAGYGKGSWQPPQPQWQNSQQQWQQQAAQKRPVPAGTQSQPAKVVKTGPTKVIVKSKAVHDDIGLQTLVGEYLEQPEKNHGRPTFKKSQKGKGDITAFLYYWDKRDGEDFSGWWFGDSVGGSQVWSRHPDATPFPPKSGWLIPHDGEVNRDLIVEPQASTAPAPVSGPPKAKPPSAPPSAPPKRPQVAAKEELFEDDDAGAGSELDDAKFRVEGVEADMNEALEHAKAMLTGNPEADTLKEVEDLFQRQSTSITETHNQLMKDSANRRKEGKKAVADGIMQLLPRLKNAKNQIVSKMQQVKTQQAKAQKAAQDNQQREQVQKRAAEAEARDLKVFNESLPPTMDAVSQAEDAVESAAILASPLTGPEMLDLGDDLQETLKATETAVQEAQKAIVDARRKFEGVMNASRKFAPEAKKTADEELKGIKEKLEEAQKKLKPLQRVRQDYEERRQAAKLIDEITDKVGEAEVEVEKIIIESTVCTDSTNPTAAEIKTISDMIPAAQKCLSDALAFIEAKSKSSSPSVKSDIAVFLDRARKSQTRLQELKKGMKEQMDKLHSQEMVKEAASRVEEAEVGLQRTADAEMPFLKGIEEIPVEEAQEAIKESERAIVSLTTLLSTARTFIQAKQREVKNFSSTEVQNGLTTDFAELATRATAVETKLTEFKKDTTERKTKMMLQEVNQKVVDAEGKAQLGSEAASSLAADKVLELSSAEIESACKQIVEAEKAASTAASDARKAILMKQKEGRGKEGDKDMQAKLSKLHSRVNAVHEQMSALRKAISTGEKAMKHKKILDEAEEKLKPAEAAVEAADEKATPMGDERLSDEQVKSIDAAISEAQVLITAMAKFQTQVIASPDFPRDAFTQVRKRCGDAQKKLETLKATTREHRERVTGETLVKNVSDVVQQAEAAVEKTSEAEEPFLKGVDALPYEEGSAAIKACEEAIEKANAGVGEARTSILSKLSEVKKFTGANSEKFNTEFAALQKRMEVAAQKLGTFKKETGDRKKVVQIQELGEKIQQGEEEVKKTTESANSLAAEDLESLSPEEAERVFEKLLSSEKVAQQKIDESRRSLANLRREVAGNAQRVTQLEDLQKKLTDISTDLAKAKKAAQINEQKFVAGKLLTEANALVKAAGEAVEKATVCSADLVVEKGEKFLNAGIKRALVEGLKELMEHKKWTKDALFNHIVNDDKVDVLDQEKLVNFLGKLPELIGAKGLDSSAEQRAAVFKSIDSDGDGKATKEEFLGLFAESYVVEQKVSMTEGPEIAGSKSFTKLDAGTVLDAIGEGEDGISEHRDDTGLLRIKCKVVETGKVGWVTVRSGQGVQYLADYSPYESFEKRLTTVMESAETAIKNAMSFVTSKLTALASCGSGPLETAKKELAELKPTIVQTQNKFEKLSADVKKAKGDQAKRSDVLKRLLSDQRSRREATKLLTSCVSKMEEVVSAQGNVQTAIAPLILEDASEEAIVAIADPLSIIVAAEKEREALDKTIADARQSIDTQKGELKDDAKGPVKEARAELVRMQKRLDEIQRKSSGIIATAQKAADRLATVRIKQIRKAVREAVSEKGVSLEAIFTEIAGVGVEEITEEAFLGYLNSLSALGLSKEHAALAYNTLTGGGTLGRHKFLDAIQEFFKCAKDVTMTAEFDVTKSKTVKKLQVGEFVEVMEGPKKDESLSGLERVKCRLVNDGSVGWVSLKGNQGTEFLKESSKPYLRCTTETQMHDGISSETLVCTLQSEDVIEVIEGPRKGEAGDAERVRGRALKDVSSGTTGWFTLKDKSGKFSAEQRKGYYTCQRAIALTDGQDIAKCKVVRKLQVGEVVQLLEGPSKDEESGVERIKAKALKDDTEGWVTTLGNAGTMYVQESTSYYVILRSVSLQNKFQSDSASSLRELAEGEVFEVLEGPRPERHEAAMRVKGRMLSDGSTGWCTVKNDNLKPWLPMYKCIKETNIQDSENLEKGKVLRKLQPNEMVEYIQGPVMTSEGLKRIKGKTEKDRLVGWMTITGNQGTTYLAAQSQ